MVEEVGGTIEWARDKLNSFPKAKRDLGPLFDALGREYHPNIHVFVAHYNVVIVWVQNR